VASAGKVYLSVPAPEEELRLATARLEKELRDFGYDVVPDKPLAERWKDAEPEIRAALTDANLLIGLLGSEYPRLAQGYNKRPGATLLELENEIAAELSIRRLLWIPQSFKREDTVSTFAETVRTYSEPGRLKPGYEWRDSHIEDFIEDIHAQLKLSRQRLPASGGSAQTLYLVCGESDHPANSSDGGRKVSKIKLHVEDQNRKDQTYSVLLPPFSVASLDDLLEAEAFLLYWGDGDAKEYFWPNLQVFNKAVGKRAAASKPFRTKILYLTDPRVQYKSECCPKNTFSVIEQYGDEAFHPNELDKYLWP
jgi:hypothetical protein